MPSRVVEVPGLTNESFLTTYAGKGRICLVGGSSWIARSIEDAEALITPDGRPSRWSHVFVFAGQREDGRHWLLESDIDLDWVRLQLRNGAQENTIEKYFDQKKCPQLAVLDLQITEGQADRVVARGLDLVRQKIMYPISGLIGTYLAYLFDMERRRNLWNTKNALYCSAFVQETYLAIGMDLAPDVATTNTAPEHIWQSPVPDVAFLRVA